LIGGFFLGALNLLLGKFTARHAIAEGEIEAGEVNPLLIGCFFSIFIPATLVWCVQMIFSEQTPFFYNWSSPQSELVLGFFITLVIIYSVWLRFGNGATYLVKLNAIMGARQNHSLEKTRNNQIIINILFVVFFGLLWFFDRTDLFN